jgi:hypothetical protein
LTGIGELAFSYEIGSIGLATRAAVGGTLASNPSVRQRAEEIALRYLTNLQNSIPEAHFVSRHGAQTTIEQQFDRATTGLTPDGAHQTIRSASRFFSHQLQLSAVNDALSIMNGNSGTNTLSYSYNAANRTLTMQMNLLVGEGFTAITSPEGLGLVQTTNVKVFFNQHGQIKSIFPLLFPL